MKELKFRKLKADEIQVRPTDTRTKGKALLLLYQDARCAMNILDETVGCDWQKDYKEVNGNIYCGIAIKMDNEWRWRWDCGSFTAKEDDMQSKADASDATKRAAVCWGIGRELYNTPKLQIKCPDSYYYNDRMNMSFTVKTIEWDEKDNLVDLVVVDKFNHTVYDYKNGGTNLFNAQDNTGMRVPPAPKVEDMKSISEQLVEFCKEAKADGADQEILKKYYNYYKDKVSRWNGRFDAKSLFEKWVAREKKPYNVPTKEDATIQEYEEHNLGADDESFYY